jgi:hypothetical protein
MLLLWPLLLAVADDSSPAGLPLLLWLLVLLFLVRHGDADRGVPRLALASVAADDSVEFLPPPSRGARR